MYVCVKRLYTIIEAENRRGEASRRSSWTHFRWMYPKYVVSVCMVSLDTALYILLAREKRLHSIAFIKQAVVINDDRRFSISFNLSE